MAAFRTAIRGLQEAQEANLRHVQNLRSGSAVNEAVKWGSTAAHRAAIGVTPWDTSALRNSHRIDFRGGQHRAYIHIDEGARNPRGQRPAIYGPHLHAQGLRPGRKGGIRAFYEQTVRVFGERIARGMARIFRGAFR